MSNRYQGILRKSAPLPPLAQNTNQIDELYAQHSINSSRGMASIDNDDDPLITENKNLEAKVAKLTEENQQIAAQNQNIIIQNDNLVKKYKILEAKIKEQDIIIHNFKEKNDQMNKEMRNLNIKLSKMPPNAEKAQKEIELLKKQIEELKSEVKKKESYISESRKCLQSKQNQIHETSREKINITDKFKNLRAQKLELESKLNLLKSEKEKLLINERNHETILNNIKTEKEQIISDLQSKLEQSQNEQNQSNQKITEFTKEIESLNDQLAKYQDTIKKGLNGIEETPENIEERNWRRNQRKEKANQLFENFKQMKLHEKELTDKVSEIQSEILIEENAAKLEMSINAPKSLKPKNDKNQEETSNENKENDQSAQQQNEVDQNTDNKDNSKNDTQSTLNKLKLSYNEVQKDLSDYIEKEEKLQNEMIKFGIKPSSFSKVDQQWTEEEDESDFTFTEIRNRVKKLRKARNEALNQLNILKEENIQLKIDLEDKNLRVEKITEIVKSMVSQRIIKPPTHK